MKTKLKRWGSNLLRLATPPARVAGRALVVGGSALVLQLLHGQPVDESAVWAVVSGAIIAAAEYLTKLNPDVGRRP